MRDVGRSASIDVLSGTSSLVGTPDEVFGTHTSFGCRYLCPAVVRSSRIVALQLETRLRCVQPRHLNRRELLEGPVEFAFEFASVP
jgi:hypothetical protein